MGKIGLEKYLVKDFVPSKNIEPKKNPYSSLSQRIKFGIDEAIKIVKKLWLWVLVGVGI